LDSATTLVVPEPAAFGSLRAYWDALLADPVSHAAPRPTAGR